MFMAMSLKIYFYAYLIHQMNLSRDTCFIIEHMNTTLEVDIYYSNCFSIVCSWVTAIFYYFDGKKIN